MCEPSRCPMRPLALALLWVAALAGEGRGQTTRAAAGPPPDSAAKAEEYMRARVQHGDFNGAVLVAHRGHPLFRAAYGLADRAFEVPNSPTTRFRIGSATKPFTAAAVLFLESLGRLKIDDPVSL